MSDIIEVAPSKDECNLAMLAHLLGIFTGFVGALVLWLVKKDDGGFAADQAKEALNFQITLTILFVACLILKVILIGALLIPIIFIANFVLSLVGAIKASKGNAYRYPFALRLVK
jgi:uncharacterized Tic20 family protein